ncbi:MAG: SEC-C metal-binding domain-containing protein [Chlamydiae bacterium]|nr:SEC-C metal-binding domain-containing protein [Chlamydiota bacterium]
MGKTGRNDPCPCGSGEKFKKCCANKSPVKKMQAHLISQEASPSATEETVKISKSFFQKIIPSNPTLQNKVIHQKGPGEL